MQKLTKTLLRRRATKLLALVIFLLSFSFITTASAQGNSELSDLWIDFSLGTPLLDLFNTTARNDDIARVEHISQLELLEDVTVGKKLVVFKSADDAIRLLPHIYDAIDIVGYNLEHGPANPINEQEDPVGSIMRLRRVVDEYGLEIALGPDRRFAESHAAEMAPYADYLILQVQKVQTEPQTVYEFALPIIVDVREANPDIEISVQIRTEGDVDDLLAMLEPLREQLDGISILTSEETIAVSDELVKELRPVRIEPTPTPIEKDAPAISGVFPEVSSADVRVPTIGDLPEELDISATAIATGLAETEVLQELSLEGAGAGSLSTPEANQRAGSNWLFIIIALIVGVALGAGFVSYKVGS